MSGRAGTNVRYELPVGVAAGRSSRLTRYVRFLIGGLTLQQRKGGSLRHDVCVLRGPIAGSDGVMTPPSAFESSNGLLRHSMTLD